MKGCYRLKSKIKDTSENRETYRASDVAEKLDISLRSAYNLLDTTEEFGVIKIGKSVRVHKKDFDAWLAAQKKMK